ncbi:MAG TPA: hypothetical protein VHW69_09895 [Rhizomicrobium sp.]|nr:hypothetical protein [Rhizomicrobium sp.]
MSERERLPNRRNSVAFEYDLEGVRYRAQVSHFADGRPAEIFLNGPKIGSAAQVAAHDAAVAASLALQLGCPATVLSHALLRLANSNGAGPVGKALDLLGVPA